MAATFGTGTANRFASGSDEAIVAANFTISAAVITTYNSVGGPTLGVTAFKGTFS